MQPNEAFQPTDKTYVINGAAAPGATPIQIGGPTAGLMQVHCMNVDPTNLAYLVYGPTSAACAANAAAVPSSGTPVYCITLHPSSNSASVYTFPPGTWFTVISSAGTPNVHLCAGQGKL